jgi:hypothetical protein
MERKCALLSLVFSDVLTFHVTNTLYGHIVGFVLAIVELVVGLSLREAPAR